MPRPKALPEIDPDRCTGCGRCVAAARYQLPLGSGVQFAQDFRVFNRHDGSSRRYFGRH